MQARRDPNPIPAWAVTMWDTETDIFVALPMTAGGTPYIMKFDRTESGLARALRILRAQRTEALTPTHDQPANYTLPANQPMVRRTKAQQLRAETTEAQREAARKLVAKLGLK